MIGKPVIFLGHFHKLESALSPIRKICKELGVKPLIVHTNYDIKLLLGSLNCEFVYFDELLTEKDYKFMDQYVYQLTKTWDLHLPELKDITVYNGIRLSELMIQDIQEFFRSDIKDLEISLKIIEKFYPTKIFFIEEEKSTFSDLSTFINRIKGIPVSYIKVNAENRGRVIKKIANNLYILIIDIASYILDKFSLKIALADKKLRGSILINYKLIPIIKGIENEFHLCPFFIEKGMRVRLKHSFKKNGAFIPLGNNIFFNFLKGRHYRKWKISERELEYNANFSYRKKLFELLQKHVGLNQALNLEDIKSDIHHILRLLKHEREEMLKLFSGKFAAEDLDRATRKRPLAIALSGIASQRIADTTGYNSSTIQSLFVKHKENEYFPYKVILLDEASMVNSVMFYQIISKIG